MILATNICLHVGKLALCFKIEASVTNMACNPSTLYFLLTKRGLPRAMMMNQLVLEAWT
jgi:hypothetical protein